MTMSLSYTLATYSSKRKFFDFFVPDNGIAALASAIKDRGGDCAYFDLNAFHTSEEDFLSFVEQNRPNIVGFKLFQSGFLHTNELAKQVRKVSPTSLVIAGGPHSTLYGEAIFQVTDAYDVIIVGEGERAIVEIGEYVTGERAQDEVRNSIWKINNEVVATERVWENDLDSLPLPDYDVFRLNEYFPIFLLNMVRGCPNQCAFCCHPYVWGRKCSNAELRGRSRSAIKRTNVVRRRSFDSIRSEIELYRMKYGVRSFSIVDSTPDLPLIRKICNLICTSRPDIKWVGFGKIDLFDDQTYEMLGRANCKCLWYGIESGNEEMIVRIGKRYSRQDIFEAIARAHRNGIRTIGGFIVGFPGETERSLAETGDLACNLGLDAVVISPYLLQPGSPIALSPEKHGIRLDADWMVRSMCVPENEEPHEVDFYEIDGLRNVQWWERFRAVSDYPGWDFDRQIEAYELATLIGEQLGLEPDEFMKEVDVILKKQDADSLHALIGKAWLQEKANSVCCGLSR
ncbi:MAG: hypothetical protein CEE38_22065 [Planctomycetes bacterium B3_Pla]|nr:MAG: hypothetical protein CEE38_22065 [Planctomycetes bacterium B3_Pla]